ncbi:MAG: hypothetical protein J6C92_15005, partial [Bacteroidaceae bacterium]|nr:hypothetical protein [Bacteroidaceae bacterium]
QCNWAISVHHTVEGHNPAVLSCTGRQDIQPRAHQDDTMLYLRESDQKLSKKRSKSDITLTPLLVLA